MKRQQTETQAIAPAEQLRAAIAAVEAERDAYITNINVGANRQIAYFNGKIDALRSLLPPDPAPAEPTPPAELPDAPQ